MNQGAVIMLDGETVIYVLPGEATQRLRWETQEQLSEIGKDLGYRFLVLPGPASVFDFRGNEALKALAEKVAEEIDRALA